MSDHELARRIEQLDARAAAIGSELLVADSARGRIVDERDAASSVLASFLAEQYKQAGARGTVTRQLLVAESFEEMVDRLKVVDAIGSYHRGVIESLVDAESRLDASHDARAGRINALGAVQEQLAPLQQEQARRFIVRDEWRAKRDAAARTAAAAQQARRDADAAAAAASQGALVGDTGTAAGAATDLSASTPVTPFVPAGTAPTAAVLDAYLASKGSPMAGQGAAFMASGMRWQVDPRLLVAIAGAESAFGKVTCGPHNAWGWACPNDPADFGTWADGIDTVTRGLRRYYLDEGRTSVSLVQQKYCPVGAANDPTGLNHNWTRNVTRFLLELGGNPGSIGPGPSTGDGALELPGIGSVAID